MSRTHQEGRGRHGFIRGRVISRLNRSKGWSCRRSEWPKGQYVPVGRLRISIYCSHGRNYCNLPKGTHEYIMVKFVKYVHTFSLQISCKVGDQRPHFAPLWQQSSRWDDGCEKWQVRHCEFQTTWHPSDERPPHSKLQYIDTDSIVQYLKSDISIISNTGCLFSFLYAGSLKFHIPTGNAVGELCIFLHCDPDRIYHAAHDAWIYPIIPSLLGLGDYCRYRNRPPAKVYKDCWRPALWVP